MVLVFTSGSFIPKFSCFPLFLFLFLHHDFYFLTEEWDTFWAQDYLRTSFCCLHKWMGAWLKIKLLDKTFVVRILEVSHWLWEFKILKEEFEGVIFFFFQSHVDNLIFFSLDIIVFFICEVPDFNHLLVHVVNAYWPLTMCLTVLGIGNSIVSETEIFSFMKFQSWVIYMLMFFTEFSYSPVSFWILTFQSIYTLRIFSFIKSLSIVFVCLCQLKKICTVWELRVKFYLGQYEDCCLGGSTSDSSEKLPNCSKDTIYVILIKGEYMESSTDFLVESFCLSREASASHKKQSSPRRTLGLFSIWRDIRIGLIKSAPEDI